MSVPLPRPDRLTSFALVLLFLLSQLLATTEVSAHPPCQPDDAFLQHVDDTRSAHSGAGRDSHSDHGATEHACHIHLTAHGCAAALEASIAERPSTRFPPLVTALTGLALPPPVPPPTAPAPLLSA